jgi:hypothetical protein
VEFASEDNIVITANGAENLTQKALTALYPFKQ